MMLLCLSVKLAKLVTAPREPPTRPDLGLRRRNLLLSVTVRAVVTMGGITRGAPEAALPYLPKKENI